jgi:hypothetical protein
MQEPRFVTNEQRQTVEVVLDVTTYETLRGSDPLLLRDLTLGQLQALADGKLTTDVQGQLSSLIANEKAGLNTSEETAMLDQLLRELDQLDMLKARALYTLHKVHGLEYIPKPVTK